MPYADSGVCIRPSHDFRAFGAVEPGNAASVSSAKYKTELCRAFEEQGYCRYGSKCLFAHGRSEVRTLDRHPKYKTDLCYAFHTTGFCAYGTRCHFIHNEEERRQHSTSQRSPVSASQHQQFSQQPGDASLGGVRRSSQMNGDELERRKLLLQIARVMSLLDGRQVETHSSLDRQLKTSFGQSRVDAQQSDGCADLWAHCSGPSSTSVLNERASNSSPVAFRTRLMPSTTDVRVASVTSSFTNDVTHLSPIQMTSSTNCPKSPPGLPPLPASTVDCESRSLSYEELTAIALMKQVLRSNDVNLQDIVDFVQSCNIKAGAYN